MRVLVIDDEEGVRRSLTAILEDEGYEIVTAVSGRRGLSLAREERPDLILCDVRMPELDGLEFLERHQEEQLPGLVIMITAYGSTELALKAIRKGAYDYLAKPFSADEVVLVLKKAEEREELRREVDRLRSEVRTEERHGDIVAQSDAMREAIELGEKVARHPTSVLVTGESGTGKELIARLIHKSSPRRDARFIPINCGAIPENLLESELFGHAAGSFTGAESDQPGLFEEASGGTLLFDEIAELPAELQVKLLRALQEGEVRRIGESESREVDVRIVAATARDLESEVDEGRFRSDLFYRINVVRIHLPPLRHRREDIPPLVRHFITKYNRKLGTDVEKLSSDAMKMLHQYQWPGNVRELENVIERSLVLAEGENVTVENLPESVREPQQVPLHPSSTTLSRDNLSIKRHTAALEKRLISRALDITDGNRTKAADLVDLSYRALLYKIKDYDLDD